MSGMIRTASGIEQLDEMLDGLFIGDNVVWHDDAGNLAWIFYLHFLRASQLAECPIIFVSYDQSPKSLAKRLGPLADYPYLTILDCFTHGKGESAPIFLKFYQERTPALSCRVVQVEEPADPLQFSDLLYTVHSRLSGNVRIVFDSLTGMQELWDDENEVFNFYSHTCPRLYELDSIAYWIMEKSPHSQKLKENISKISQVVIDLSVKRGTTYLTIIKADNRDITHINKTYPYWSKNDRVAFDQERRTTGALDLGGRIKELRGKRGLSQTELARQVGVTPSTISQVENNLIYPSLPALHKMAETLNVQISSFFAEKSPLENQYVFKLSESVIHRIPTLSPEQGEIRRLTPIDLPARAEPYLIEIQPGQTVSSHFFNHKGEELGCLITGRLDVKIGTRILSLHSGDVISLTADTPTSWHNPANDPARLLWIKVS